MKMIKRKYHNNQKTTKTVYQRLIQAKGILSVAVTHSYPVPSCDSRVRLQREAAADKAEERAQRKAVRQEMRAENANPRVRSGAAPGGSLAPPSPASQSSAASSARFASSSVGTLSAVPQGLAYWSETLHKS